MEKLLLLYKPLVRTHKIYEFEWNSSLPPDAQETAVSRFR